MLKYNDIKNNISVIPTFEYSNGEHTGISYHGSEIKLTRSGTLSLSILDYLFLVLKKVHGIE